VQKKTVDILKPPALQQQKKLKKKQKNIHFNIEV